MQLAWSHNSRAFLAIGNGKDSALVVYSVSKEPSLTVKQLWVLRAMDCPIPVSDQLPPDPARERSPQTSAAKDPAGGHLPGEKALYMAEFNPSGNIFAVEEVFYRTTLIHLVSPKGKVLKSMDVMAKFGERDSRPVNSLFISTYHEGIYALGLEGGTVVLVDAELLEFKKSFKVVRRLVLCILCTPCDL
jgi:hypothetical protein